jgi:hypothetical protein
VITLIAVQCAQFLFYSFYQSPIIVKMLLALSLIAIVVIRPGKLWRRRRRRK